MSQQTNNRVLIIDDNESIHADFRKILGQDCQRETTLERAAKALFESPDELPVPQLGFEVTSAFQGQQGLHCVEESLLADRPFAVIFIDMRMPPGWDGIKTLEKIWQIDSHVQIVICTAFSDYNWTAMMAALGENDRWLVLKKPFDNIEVRQLATALVAKWHSAAIARKTLRELQQMVSEQTLAINIAHEETIFRLLEASFCRDLETGSHVRRTGLYSELMAAAAGWESAHVNWLRLAAPMHDVGKIGIPDAILRKPGRLTTEETTILRTHTTLGGAMLAGSKSPILRMARDIALHHHEHWNGGGYPHGIAGCLIPEAARIVSIVDVYDALSHDRVYRKALPEAEVLQTMREARGTHFDPHLFDIFVSLLPEMRAITEAVPDESEPRDSAYTPVAFDPDYDLHSLPVGAIG
jgi:putative two-component system response regulator